MAVCPHPDPLPKGEGTFSAVSKGVRVPRSERQSRALAFGFRLNDSPSGWNRGGMVVHSVAVRKALRSIVWKDPMPQTENERRSRVARSMQLYERALELIPGGTQLISRRPTRYAAGVS